MSASPEGIDTARYRALLEKERAELDALVEDTRSDSAPVALDQQSVGRLSRMDAMQSQAMAKATRQRRTERRAAILAALERMDEDEFGWCVECGDAISPKRLDVDPTFARCIKCA